MSNNMGTILIPQAAYDPAFWRHPCPQVAENVAAVTHDGPGGTLFVSFVLSLAPGRGFVSRYLDALPADRRVVFPDVLNSNLAAALERRGFRRSMGLAVEWRQTCFSFVREASPARVVPEGAGQ